VSGVPNPFETLQPPRGGLAALRGRLEADGRGRARARRMRFAAAAACVAFLGIMLTWMATRTRDGRPRAGLDGEGDPFRMVRLEVGLAAPPEEPLTIPPGQRHRLAAHRVPVESERVVFYRVASLDAEEEVVAEPVPE
jgi:hypothetical protein